MKSISIALTVIYFTTVVCDAEVLSACAAILCPVGTVCKESIVNCIKAPCPPQAYCAPINKPGICPVQDGIGLCVVKCNDDSDCKGQLKCCGSCPKQCQKPIPIKPLTCQTVRCKAGYVCKMRDVICKKAPCPQRPICIPINKPGICPVQDGIGPCVVKCNDDSDCKGQLKCCGSCPKQCQKPIPIKPLTCQTVRCKAGYVCKMRDVICKKAPCPQRPICIPISKPGRCPLQKLAIIGLCTAKPKCVRDSDCLGDMKCCGRCPRQCQKPQIEEVIEPPTCETIDCKPGYICKMRTIYCFRAPCPSGTPYCAPINKPGICPVQDGIGPCVVKCNDDSDCKGQLKCCGSCPKQCQKPIPIKPLTCQTVRCKAGYVCKMRDVICKKAPCPQRPICIPISKPGRCPLQKLAIIGLCTAKPKCVRDSDCLGDMKCCGRCPRQCQKPQIEEVIEPPTCETIDCKPGYICKMRTIYCFRAPCPSGTPYCAPITKPGSCPRRRINFGRLCRSECKHDQDCPGNKKCCGFGRCHRHCEDPITTLPVIKPGRCPLTPFPGLCPQGMKPECGVDTDCPGKQKCCGRCPRVCTEPIRVKPGVCPVSRRPCLTEDKDECVNDLECRGRRKCCRIACHNKCVYPYRLRL